MKHSMMISRQCSLPTQRLSARNCTIFTSGSKHRSVLACSHKADEDRSLQSKVETLLGSVKWDEKGLAVAIAQNVDTGAILMQGFVNRDALATTISSRKATFYSRSRSKLWIKGETSKNFIQVHDILLDCDRDSIIYLGKPDGPTCHTGAETCYYTSCSHLLGHVEVEENKSALTTTLYSLESTISQRKAELSTQGVGKPSWTKKLLLGSALLCKKIRYLSYDYYHVMSPLQFLDVSRLKFLVNPVGVLSVGSIFQFREEANELCQTLEDNEDKSRTASEMADVLYHSMVLLALKDVKMEEVLQVLRQRFTKSGIEEKMGRTS
ncbi:Histidine biosynthesis bifunctional protein hisIE, chloroplastic [Dionaea muscipula]